jgi:hypothetical protein
VVRKLTEEVGRVRGSLDTLFEDIGEDLVTWLEGGNASLKSKAQSPKGALSTEDSTSTEKAPLSEAFLHPSGR